MIEITQLRFCRLSRDRRGAKYLAKRLGMNASLLAAVERGHRGEPGSMPATSL